jgi:uncharacterized membrane protein
MKFWTRMMLFAYFGTLAWQVIWISLLPPPFGPGNLWLTVFACLPLLLPVAGLVRHQHRSMIWGGVLLILYFTAAVTEAWTNPAHRWPALIQITLVIIYIFAFKNRIRARRGCAPESG